MLIAARLMGIAVAHDYATTTGYHHQRKTHCEFELVRRSGQKCTGMHGKTDLPKKNL